MSNRNQTHIKQIIKQFQKNFNVHPLQKLCIHIYEKQSKQIKKKFASFHSQLLLNNARCVEYKKKKQLLESWIPLFTSKETSLNRLISNSQAQELIKILDLLAEWKQSILLCLTFLNQVSSQSWISLKNQMLNNINRYYKSIEIQLKKYFQKTRTLKTTTQTQYVQNSLQKQNMYLMYSDHSQLSLNWHWKSTFLNDHQQSKGNQRFQHGENKGKKTNQKFLKKGSGFYKQYERKLYTQGDEINNQIDKREFEFKNRSSLSDNDFQIGTNGQAAQNRHSQVNIDKKETMQSNDKILIQDNSNGICSVQGKINQSKSLSVRHKSTIVSLNGFRRLNGLKHNYSSFKKLQMSNNLNNQNEASSEIMLSSKSKNILRQSKITNNFSESKNSRNSKNSGSKVIQQSKKGRQNKSKDLNFSKQQLKQIDESIHTIQKQDYWRQGQKQQLQNRVQMKEQSFQKDDNLDEFYTTHAFKEPKNRRRFAINKVINSLHSINRPDYFMQNDFKRQTFSKKAKLSKTINRTSLFRSSGLTQQRRSSSKQKNSKNFPKKLRSSHFLKKDAQQTAEVNDLFCVQENKPMKRKELSRFNTQYQETYTKYEPAVENKEIYRILTEINEHSRNEHLIKFDGYYQQLLRRKYSNFGRVYNNSDSNQFKPTTFKLQNYAYEQKANDQFRKIDSSLVDFMKISIKKNELLVLGQIGISEFEQSI